MEGSSLLRLQKAVPSIQGLCLDARFHRNRPHARSTLGWIDPHGHKLHGSRLILSHEPPCHSVPALVLFRDKSGARFRNGRFLSEMLPIFPWMRLFRRKRRAKGRRASASAFSRSPRSEGPHWRRCVEHEREIRAVGLDRSFQSDAGRPARFPDGGDMVRANLRHLIQAVYVAPEAPSHFRDLVRDVIRAYGFRFSVKQSDLNRDPVY